MPAVVTARSVGAVADQKSQSNGDVEIADATTEIAAGPSKASSTRCHGVRAVVDTSPTTRSGSAAIGRHLARLRVAFALSNPVGRAEGGPLG
jgi:hypothetical protein